MALTFNQIWNTVLLYTPGTPLPIVQRSVQNAYRKVINSHYWSELRGEGEIAVPALYSAGSASATQGSDTVSGTDTVWTEGMVGRQFSMGSTTPWYTITAVDALNQELTLDRDFEGADASGDYEIGQFYLEFPADLAILLEMRDTTNLTTIVCNRYTQEWVDMQDPSRTATGTALVAVSVPPRGTLPRYELHPRVSGPRTLLYRYYRSADLVAASDQILNVLDSNVIVYGALAELSMWPGLADNPNPLFSQEVHKMYQEEFESCLHDSEMADLDLDQRMVEQAKSGSQWALSPKYLQTHPL
jgi:hypothetical protein